MGSDTQAKYLDRATKVFPMVWRIGGLGVLIVSICLAHYSMQYLYSKDDGEALEAKTDALEKDVTEVASVLDKSLILLPEKLYTRAEGLAIEEDVEAVKKQQNDISMELRSLKIEQRVTNDKLEENKGELRQIKGLLEALVKNK